MMKSLSRYSLKTGVLLFVTMLVCAWDLHAQEISVPGFEGITFTKHDNDTEVSITENFTANGIEFAPNGLTLKYDVSANEFYIYGGATFSTEGETIEVTFGSASQPGVIIKETTLEHFEIDINTDLTLGNITVTAKDLDLQYYNSDSRYYVNGTVIVEEVFELEADMGSVNEKGLMVDASGAHPRFMIEHLTLAIKNLHGGAVDLNDFELSFNSQGITDSKVDVSFGSGQEVGADITFDENPLRINSIDIYYRAENLEDGIELFEGVQIAYMDANVVNIDKPHNLAVSGTVQTYYGEGLSIGSESATFFETGADITISRTELKIDADGNLGAVRGDGNDWNNLLGTGSMGLTVDFRKKKVNYSLDTWYPGGDDSFINFDGDVSFSLHKLDAYAMVGFYVPKKVPLLGGRELASAEGSFHFANNLKITYWDWRQGEVTKYVTDGSMAAWAEIDVGVTLRGGASVDIPSGKIHTIGSKTVKNLEEHFPGKRNSTNPTPEGQVIHSFEVTQNPPSVILFETNWHQITDSVRVEVLGPEGYYELHQVVASEAAVNEIPEFSLNHNVDVITNDSTAYLMVSTPTRFGEEQLIQPSVVDGRYSVILTFGENMPDSSTVKMHQFWQQPEIEVAVQKNANENSYEIDYNFWAAQTDSAMVTIYATDKNSTSGAKPIQTFSTADPAQNIEVDVNNFGSGSISYTPDFVSDSDSLYFYASIDDRVNPRVYSSISEAHHHRGDLHGTISFPAGADSLQDGLRLYLDENNDGKFDLESDGGLEPHAISFADGDFHFLNVEKGTYPLRIILPRGYRIVGTESRLSAMEVTYDGTAARYDIEIESYTEN
ncbi:MAG: hypothetical protein ACQETE_14465 [Bacteroidota bacterium]